MNYARWLATSANMHCTKNHHTVVVVEQYCKRITSVMQDMGNPFLEESRDFPVLDTNIIVRRVDHVAQEQASNVQPTSIKRIITGKLVIASLKHDYVFSRDRMPHANPKTDLGGFFSHENETAPPSLSDYGNLRPNNKISIILSGNRVYDDRRGSAVDTKMFDGVTIVHIPR